MICCMMIHLITGMFFHFLSSTINKLAIQNIILKRLSKNLLSKHMHLQNIYLKTQDLLYTKTLSFTLKMHETHQFVIFLIGWSNFSYPKDIILYKNLEKQRVFSLLTTKKLLFRL